MIPKLAFEDSETAALAGDAFYIAATQMFGKATRYVDNPLQYDYYMARGNEFSTLAEESDKLGEQLREAERALDELATLIQEKLNELAFIIPMCSNLECLIHSKTITRDDVIGIVARGGPVSTGNSLESLLDSMDAQMGTFPVTEEY